MTVPLWVWAATVLGLLAVFALDLFFVGRDPHCVTPREAVLWLTATASLAGLFGLGLAAVAGAGYSGQFFAGWITEYSLSVDNLFVFVIIMARFAVPKHYQHRALLVGVLLALVLRGAFIAVGSAMLANFSWTFYLFGAFLVYTAAKLAASHGAAGSAAADPRENALVRLARRVYPTTQAFHGTALTVRLGERRVLTPMALVILAIGATDVLFALDSIPAIFGLTRQPYLVFTANAFALLGLRQLYFLIGGLLDRLVYLSAGLSAILGFIGVKMILEALHGSGVTRLGPLPLPVLSIPVSLGVIVATLAVTAALSLTVGRRRLDAKSTER
jgi:tellurite resistance protein TerC